MAVRILALGDDALREKLAAYAEKMARDIEKNRKRSIVYPDPDRPVKPR